MWCGFLKFTRLCTTCGVTDDFVLLIKRSFNPSGHGRLNHLVLFTSGLIMLNVSMESVGMSYVITAAECELKLSSKDKGLVNAAAFIGKNKRIRSA